MNSYIKRKNYQKLYYLKHKDKIIICEFCNRKIKHFSYKSHLNSKYHCNIKYNPIKSESIIVDSIIITDFHD